MVDPGRYSEIWKRDDKAALQYENCAVPYLLGPWAPDLLQSVTLRAGDRVLDVACGTGAVSRLAAQLVGPEGLVAGLDIHRNMLAVAQSVAQRTSSSIHWQQGDAASLPFADAAFDVVVCQQGLQFFSDRAAALGEMNRVLGSGGRMGLVVWSNIDRNPYFCVLAQAVECYLGSEAARQMRSAFALADLDALRPLIAGAGFRKVTASSIMKSLPLTPLREFIPRHLAGTSLSVSAAGLDAEAKKAMITQVEAAMHVYERQDTLTVPFETHLVVAVSSK